MPELWLLLDFNTQVQLAHSFKLPVTLVSTAFGPELRLKGIYYGNNESKEEIERIMKQPPRHYRGGERGPRGLPTG